MNFVKWKLKIWKGLVKKSLMFERKILWNRWRNENKFGWYAERNLSVVNEIDLVRFALSCVNLKFLIFQKLMHIYFYCFNEYLPNPYPASLLIEMILNILFSKQQIVSSIISIAKYVRNILISIETDFL